MLTHYNLWSDIWNVSYMFKTAMIMAYLITLQLVYDFGERVLKCHTLLVYIRCKILFRKKFVFKYSVYKC